MASKVNTKRGAHISIQARTLCNVRKEKKMKVRRNETSENKRQHAEGTKVVCVERGDGNEKYN